MEAKNFKEQYSEIKSVVESNRLVEDRVSKLTELGYNTEELPMGSGGVLQVKIMADGDVRIQIGYGKGKHNYAMCVVLDKPLRYEVTELVVYRKSNTTRKVYFSDMQEAIEFAREQYRLHPRSKKLNHNVFDLVNNRSFGI